MTDEELFTADDVEAALCIWEYCIHTRNRGHDFVFDWLRDGEGAAAARDKCISLAKDCERSYKIAHRLGYDTSFDWEFVPAWVDLAIDLTHSQDLAPEWVDYMGRKIYHEFRLEQ